MGTREGGEEEDNEREEEEALLERAWQGPPASLWGNQWLFCPRQMGLHEEAL